MTKEKAIEYLEKINKIGNSMLDALWARGSEYDEWDFYISELRKYICDVAPEFEFSTKKDRHIPTYNILEDTNFDIKEMDDGSYQFITPPFKSKGEIK